MSVRDIIGSNIESAKSEIGATTETKLDGIKSGHMKPSNPLTQNY